MTPEEALNVLSNTNFSVNNEAEEQKCRVYQAAFKTAIEALEKQVPKKPKYEDVDNIYGAIKRTCTACGDVCMVSKCAKPYEHYCRQCGQALDWSDTND